MGCRRGPNAVTRGLTREQQMDVEGAEWVGILTGFRRNIDQWRISGLHLVAPYYAPKPQG